MRIPLVKDAAELAAMAYWSKEELESLVTLETSNVTLETTNVTLETSNVTLETSNVTLETSNVTLETSNVTSNVTQKLTKPIKFHETSLDA
jgi:phage baseplate assembly protein gpV